MIADFPGQIELYLGGESVLRIVHRLQEAFDLRVCSFEICAAHS